jgi:transposase-like protein
MDYTLEFKKRVIAMVEGGRSVGAVAEELDIPYHKVSRWVMFGVGGGVAVRDRSRGVSPEQAEAAVARVIEDRNRYAHFYDNPNVALLGDPPLHRSVLGKRLIEEGRL